jgi:hypothetical protein
VFLTYFLPLGLTSGHSLYSGQILYSDRIVHEFTGKRTDIEIKGQIQAMSGHFRQ